MNYTVVILDKDNQIKEFYFEKYDNAKSFFNSLLQSMVYGNYSDLQIIMFDKDGYIINE